MAARQSAINTVTMTGSPRRLQELAPCCIQSSLPFASDEGGALMAARQSANQHGSTEPEDHRTLHNEVDRGGNPLGNHERNDLDG
jgi:hypothetical protein